MKWKTLFPSTSPLIILEFGRLISTASVDYQVHIGEYGVHWNFFFMLAAVSMLTSFTDINPQYCGVLGLLLLVGYQISLLCGLNEYLLSNKRSVDFIRQNKEGIFCIFGYWGMYLVGVHFGNSLFFRDNTTTRIRSNQRTTIRIWALAILFWLSTVILDKFVESVSRRMCNLAMLLWYLLKTFRHCVDRLDQHVCGNHLCFIYSLLAILIGYAFVLCIAAGFAELSGIKLKLW